MNSKHLKRHLNRFNRCFTYHESTKDEQGNITRDSFVSFSDESMQKDSKLYDYYHALSNVLHNIDADTDSKYQYMSVLVDELVNQANYKKFDSVDDVENLELHELIDSNVDIYTSDLTKWLNKSVYNVYYLKEAISEFGATEGTQILSFAQYAMINEIMMRTQSAIVEFLNNKN